MIISSVQGRKPGKGPICGCLSSYCVRGRVRPRGGIPAKSVRIIWVWEAGDGQGWRHDLPRSQSRVFAIALAQEYSSTQTGIMEELSAPHKIDVTEYQDLRLAQFQLLSRVESMLAQVMHLPRSQSSLSSASSLISSIPIMDIILGLGIALPIVTTTGISVTTGVAQGVQEQHKQNADASNQTRMLKFHLDVWVDALHRKGPGASLHGGIVTIREGKVWIEPKNPTTNLPEHMAKGSHPFTGFYLAYPDDNRSYTRGIVTTISVDPPMLNWMYIDKDTYECKVASRSGSIMHHVGDYDWTSEESENSMVTFDEFEGFVAVQEREEAGELGWALYFDLDDDGLKQKRTGRKVCECHLQRRVITGQEVNKWGLKEEGNMGFKATEEVNKLRKEKKEQKAQGKQGDGDVGGGEGTG